ncbi:unnamed protein product [Adineta steineri]|uniref:Uncharacterized protein n=1 Tax=Adineta steineri TaxID=433720 RepID=A0A816A8Q3_9BILA|nr:unnamed protein product [Adineta steineri]CAF1591907.1 unnamed protein product [Adineta steineri]
MNERIHKTDQLQSSLSIETLQDIVRNYQRTEQRLQELERYTRHEHDLSRRCDDLLSRLKTDRNQRTILKNKDCNSYLQKSSSQQIDQSITLRQVLTFLRSSDPNILNEEINQVLKKKHEQPSTYNDELEKSPISEIQRRNYLRTEILRIRLRQHHLLHSGTKIDDSLKMIDI